MQIDAQKVINNLGARLTNEIIENATLKTQVEMLQEQLAAKKAPVDISTEG